MPIGLFMVFGGMSEKDKKLTGRATGTVVSDFLRQVAQTPAVVPAGQRGRLVFAMDATASREPSWDRACAIQCQMFEETAALGGLDVQLCYYRGQGEFFSTPWLSRAHDLQQRMVQVRCLAGMTQIEKVLVHALKETTHKKVNALVFVGDCMEESVDRLGDLAGQLGLHAVPVFVFHEGGDPVAERAFRRIARLSKGAYCPFDAGSAHQLADLLSAVAVYAAGGHRALEALERRRGGAVPLLLQALDRD